MKKGTFITFEGPDGAGKSTQARNLAALLRAKGKNVILTREPGGTPFGDRVRNILLDPDTGAINPITELLMYESIRAHHVETVIKPAIQRGDTVISDRFTDASLAYQGYGRKIPIATVKTLNKIATFNLIPNLTIIIDCNSAAGLKAAQKDERAESKPGRLDRIEAAGPAFHKRVRDGYKKIAKEAKKRVIVINRQRTAALTFDLIRKALNL